MAPRKKVTADAAENKATVNTAAPAADKEITEAAAKEKETVKKAPAKKAPAKRTAASKAAKSAVYVQFAGKEFSDKDLVEAAKKAYAALGNKESDIKTIDIYVKPEENAAYYAVNGEGSDAYRIEL